MKLCLIVSSVVAVLVGAIGGFTGTAYFLIGVALCTWANLRAK